MKAMILAAGLGTRLKPWTLEHPKALVPVGGKPMLQRVFEKLSAQGFDDIVINVHHFSNQIIEFVDDYKRECLNLKLAISDESERLLDTGGGLLHAGRLLDDAENFLVHNVDILSNADLGKLMQMHIDSYADITLLTSGRDSSRKLIFNNSGELCGWHNLVTDEYRPEGFLKKGGYLPKGVQQYAFSGIYVVKKSVIERLKTYSASIGKEEFPILDFFMQCVRLADMKIKNYYDPALSLIDIGKPDTLRYAVQLVDRGECCDELSIV